MLICQLCQKGRRTIAFSRHKKGSSGAGGTWALRAPIHKKLQRPNLHTYMGMKLCTKCLRAVKPACRQAGTKPSLKKTIETQAVPEVA